MYMYYVIRVHVDVIEGCKINCYYTHYRNLTIIVTRSYNMYIKIIKLDSRIKQFEKNTCTPLPSCTVLKSFIMLSVYHSLFTCTYMPVIVYFYINICQ